MKMSAANPPSLPTTIKQSQAARACTPTPAPQADYYDNEDLLDTESECETPSDRSQFARYAAEPADISRAQMFRKNIANRDHQVYPPDLYVAPSEYYYGTPSGYQYLTPAPAPVGHMKKQRSNVLSTQMPMPTRQPRRVCTAHAHAPAPVPIHHYYPQQYAIPQSSMVLHDDGMTMYGGGIDGMPSVPVVPLAQVSPQVSGAGGAMYHQQAQRHSADHLQVPLAPFNRFRSSLHTAVANIRPPIPPRKTNAITVRTPRYIRRPCANSSLYKKPSTLCLPLACQPDPAVHRRYSKPIASIDPLQDDLQSKTNKLQQQQQPRRSKHPQDDRQPSQSASLTAELQPTLSQSQLDALFANYEELYLRATTSSGYPLGYTQPKGKIMATMMGLGPPRVPKHIQKRRREIIRAKQHMNQLAEQTDMLNVVQDRGDSKDSNASNMTAKSFAIPKDAETFDVQEITSQVLQELMCDMVAGNDTADATMDDKMAMGEEILNDTDTTDCTKRDGLTGEPMVKKIIDLHAPKKNKDHVNKLHLSDTLPESFNYQDIAQNISKSKMAFHEEDEEDISTATQKHSTNTSHDHLKSEMGSSSDKINRMASQKSLKSLKCSRVTNVAEAMELHRTKSYVVNLIDTALSNHFGTSVCDKYSSYECSGLNPVNLIETLKKHSLPKLEKDVCLEIAQALNQTYSNCNTGPERTDNSVEDSNKPDSCCSCKGESSEPTYIKYLRQLRWGHLKHIQAEAKRLEELERFFDSCSKKAFCEKYP